MKKDTKILLKKNIILNKDLSSNAILAYVGLAICLKLGMDFVYADKNMLYYYLTGSMSPIPRRFEDNLKSGLEELLVSKVITCKKKQNSSYYFATNDFIIDKSENYIMVYLSEINKIICCNSNGKIGMLRYYLCLLSTFIINNSVKDIKTPDKYNNKLGMLSQEYISEITCVSERSIVEYNKLLEQLQIIYISRCSFSFRDKDGTVKKQNNIYGRYNDRAAIEDFTKIKYDVYDELHKKQKVNTANYSRSLTQKYNCIRNGKKYDEATMNEVYDYICEYNKKHPNKQKDTSMFVIQN